MAAGSSLVNAQPEVVRSINDPHPAGAEELGYAITLGNQRTGDELLSPTI